MKISRVDMDLAFDGSESMTSTVDKEQNETALAEGLKRALRSIDADFREEDVRIQSTNDVATPENNDKMIHARFTLRGNNCATMAYKIEQLVRAIKFRVYASLVLSNKSLLLLSF